MEQKDIFVFLWHISLLFKQNAKNITQTSQAIQDGIPVDASFYHA